MADYEFTEYRRFGDNPIRKERPMKSSSKPKTIEAIKGDFFNRNTTTFETYYRLRIKGVNQDVARVLLHKWLTERARLEAIFGKRKE